jgi:heme-degrading monooxygenase HmoA
MILEVAILDVIPSETVFFEQDFKLASEIISSMKGYVNHELQSCIEKPARYILLVKWNTLEDHTVGFRQSQEYKQWKSLLHKYYDPFPIVEHYKLID